MKYAARRIFQATYILGLVVLSGCASTTLTSPSAGQDRATIHALQKRLHDRERTIAIQDHQIEVLSSQLEALKQIEQDAHDQRRSVRRSAIVTP